MPDHVHHTLGRKIGLARPFYRAHEEVVTRTLYRAAVQAGCWFRFCGGVLAGRNRRHIDVITERTRSRDRSRDRGVSWPWC